MATEKNSVAYPSPEFHATSWEELAREIATTAGSMSGNPSGPPEKRGSLTVLGSGIETVGFHMGDKSRIEQADRVFFCVADPATVVWIRRLRPDAYDLYVLYDDSKPRYTTYMQMAEAMLYSVRQGLDVVAIYYGHPGVFVLSTHRAVEIAKREGHRAVMRSNVCALDCLCSDLGIDPAHPGLQTHEATDMLVRLRRPDVSLHVVLWQVGLIGEMGFRRKGYINQNFSKFIEYIQGFYGEDYPVTNYVASRYPTIKPEIETLPLHRFHDPAIQARVTGVSTFYLAPKDAIPADVDMVKKLGLLKPGQSVKTPSGPLRSIAQYGYREMRAFKDFETFSVPSNYQWQADTGASDFLIELQGDPQLQAAYAEDPQKALRDPRFSNISEKDRAMLATRKSGLIQLAAKGHFRDASANTAVIRAILRNRSFCSTIAKSYSRETKQNLQQQVNELAKEMGIEVDWQNLAHDVEKFQRSSLLPWTGVYAAEEESLCITLLGGLSSNKNSVLFVNDTELLCFKYRAGELQWSLEDGNPHNGFVRMDVDARGQRWLFGSIWSGDESQPADKFFKATEIDPDRKSLLPLSQHFTTSDTSDGDLNGIYTLRIQSRTQRISLEIQGYVILVDAFPVEVTNLAGGKLAWRGGPQYATEAEISVLCDPFLNSPELYGSVTTGIGEKQHCFGSRLDNDSTTSTNLIESTIPDWVFAHLAFISRSWLGKGSLLLWHKWEKHVLTSRVVNQVLTKC